MKIFLTLLLTSAFCFSWEVDDYLNSLKQNILKSNPNFKGFDYKRGEEIFNTKSIGKKGKLISCASCHTTNLYNEGKHYFTGKDIAPLSPTRNPYRLTDEEQLTKWLKRNFLDVYGKEGTDLEKGDVLTFIINQKL